MPRLDILERKSEILQWIEEKQTKAYMCSCLNCKNETLNKYLKLMNIEYKGQKSKKGQYKGGTEYKPALYYIENNIPLASHKLKLKLFRDGLKEEKCEICGISIWQGKQIPLELHHIDCNHYNNTLSNLQILCPNCHSIQPGNSGANIKSAAVMELADSAHLECAAVRRASSNLASGTNNKYCIECGTKISHNAQRCKNCENKRRQTEKPVTREELKNLIRFYPMLQIGKKFNVSDNAIRNWCKGYELPYKVSEIKKYTDEEWKLI